MLVYLEASTNFHQLKRPQPRPVEAAIHVRKRRPTSTTSISRYRLLYYHESFLLPSEDCCSMEVTTLTSTVVFAFMEVFMFTFFMVPRIRLTGWPLAAPVEGQVYSCTLWVGAGCQMGGPTAGSRYQAGVGQ